MDKEERAQRLLDNADVFFLGTRNNRIHFIVKGRKIKAYEVSRELRTPKWYCTCDNVLFTKEHCAHIIACEIYAVRNKLIGEEA